MMKPKHNTKHEADKLVRDIKRATRRKFSAEEKIRSFWRREETLDRGYATRGQP